MRHWSNHTTLQRADEQFIDFVYHHCRRRVGLGVGEIMRPNPHNRNLIIIEFVAVAQQYQQSPTDDC
jgi:hypothetical protein